MIDWKTAYPEFGEQYARAMDTRTKADFESLDDEIQQTPPLVEGRVDQGWVAWQRLRIDTKKWALSKRAPKDYGDKMTLDGDLNLSLASRLKEARENAERARE